MHFRENNSICKISSPSDKRFSLCFSFSKKEIYYRIPFKGDDESKTSGGWTQEEARQDTERNELIDSTGYPS